MGTIQNQTYPRSSFACILLSSANVSLSKSWRVIQNEEAACLCIKGGELQGVRAPAVHPTSSCPEWVSHQQLPRISVWLGDCQCSSKRRRSDILRACPCTARWHLNMSAGLRFCRTHDVAESSEFTGFPMNTTIGSADVALCRLFERTALRLICVGYRISAGAEA